MTKDEIVKSLRACGRVCCDDCVCFQENVSCKEKDLGAAELIEQQTAKIAELEAKVPRWISVTERLPEIEQRVLVLDRHGNAMVRTLRCLTGEKEPSFRPDGLVPRKHITHWMPLPEPPETDGGGEDG